MGSVLKIIASEAHYFILRYHTRAIGPGETIRRDETTLRCRRKRARASGSVASIVTRVDLSTAINRDRTAIPISPRFVKASMKIGKVNLI